MSALPLPVPPLRHLHDFAPQDVFDFGDESGGGVDFVAGGDLLADRVMAHPEEDRGSSGVGFEQALEGLEFDLWGAVDSDVDGSGTVSVRLSVSVRAGARAAIGLAGAHRGY